jgi:hypothetical protein
MITADQHDNDRPWFDRLDALLHTASVVRPGQTPPNPVALERAAPMHSTITPQERRKLRFLWEVNHGHWVRNAGRN